MLTNGVIKQSDFKQSALKRSPFNNALLPIICALGILSYTPITHASTFNGATEISSQDFKELVINGPAKLNQITADSFTNNGPVNFTRLTVKGKTKISGPTSGEEADFEDLTIHGPFWGSKVTIANLYVDGDVALEDFKVKGTVNINGPLKAKNGSFNNINAVYEPVALYNVNVNNITIKDNKIKSKKGNTSKDNNDKDKSTNENEENYQIKLAGNTVVSGNITFESGNGIVFVRDKTAQIKGKVIGGKIKNQWAE